MSWLLLLFCVRGLIIYGCRVSIEAACCTALTGVPGFGSSWVQTTARISEAAGARIVAVILEQNQH